MTTTANWRLRSALCALALCFSAAPAWADGSDPGGLGAPSIPIATGSGIVGAGTGMVSQPGIINLNVPAGVTIQQVILYWEGLSPTAGSGDDTITVNGVPVIGTSIGGPTLFFSPPTSWSTTFRADITALSAANNWVLPGANVLTITDFSFGQEDDGAGVLVIYDDGVNAAQIDLRDGNDLAFFAFAPPLDATVQQKFNFASAPFDRQADVVLFVGSVDIDRASTIRITSGGNTTDLVDILGNTDGPQWDTVSDSVVVPANVSSIGFEIISGPSGGPQPASLAWLTASFAVLPPATIIIKAVTIPPGGTGFSFTDDVEPPGNFLLDDGQMLVFPDVLPGDYTVDEEDPMLNPGGWALIDLVCEDTNSNGVDSTVNLATGTSSIHLEPGETVTCTYTHTRQTGTIVIDKATNPPGGLGFDFSDTIEAPNGFTLDDGQSKTFLDIPEGAYSVTELDPALVPGGWGLSGLVCNDSDPAGTFSTVNLVTRTATINLDAGEIVSCTFTNTELPGTVVINKVTTPAGGTGFGFTGNVGIPNNFVLNDGGSQVFNNVPAGSYSVSENDPMVAPGGFDLSTLVCVDSDAGGTPSSTSLATRTANINVDPGETVTCTFTNAEPEDCRMSASQKGSLLIFPKIELRWEYVGNTTGSEFVLVQDTFIDLTNDYPDSVCVQMYYINGDPEDYEYLCIDRDPECNEGRWHPGWNNVDVGICLTANQPTYWSAATGLPGTGGVSPFTILDPGNPPGRPDPEGSGDRVMRGYLVAWAVDNLGQEIRWNHLKGDAVIVNYRDGSAWEYTAYTSRVINVGHGLVSGTPGQLHLDGTEYCPPYSQLLLDFYAVGSSAFDKNGRPIFLNTDLTLLPVDVDLRQETDGPVTTKAAFTVWNQNEVKLTGMDLCVTCWDQRLVTSYGVPNHFLVGNLQTDKGKAQIDGIHSQLCDVDYDQGDFCTQTFGGPAPACDPRDVLSADAALLGVVAKQLEFGREAVRGFDPAVRLSVDRAGMNLIGMGKEDALIQADLLGTTPPERPQEPAPLPNGMRIERIERRSATIQPAP